jgi:membrane protein
VVTARRTLELYGAAGGGLLAAGLAYTGLFAVLSASLFVVGVIGLIVRDPGREATIVAELARRLPPLAELFQTGIDRVAGGALQVSIAALLGLAWGIGGFYGNLDTAFSRVFRDTPRRGFRSRAIRGFVVVGILVLVIVAAAVLASVGSVVDASFVERDSPLVRFGSTAAFYLVGLALYAGGVAAVYQSVPPRPPSWKACAWPTLLVAVVLSIFTNAFVLLQTRLLGSLELFAGFVVVLATMIWLSIGFQILLLGAAWVCVRDEPPVVATPPVGAAPQL